MAIKLERYCKIKIILLSFLVDKLASWRDCEVGRWWIDGFVSWRACKLINLRDGERANWRVDKLTSLVSWRICKVGRGRVDGLASWWVGKLMSLWVVELLSYRAMPYVNRKKTTSTLNKIKSKSPPLAPTATLGFNVLHTANLSTINNY